MAKRDRESIQKMLLEQGKTNFVTTEAVDEVIVCADYHQFPGTTVTVCCITLTNGFTVVGQSACADAKNFDPQMGRDFAYDDAKQQVFRLLAFRMCDTLADAFRERTQPVKAALE